MKRATGWINQRMGVSNPCGSLIVCGFMSICVAIYIISIAITMSQFTARDLRINSVDQIALRSQQSTLYKATEVCMQHEFATYFDNNIYFDEARISYRHRPDEFFDYQAFSKDHSMTACTGILVYQSLFLSASEPNVKQRISSVAPIVDIPARKFKLLLNTQATEFYTSMTALLGKKNADGSYKLS